MKKSIIVITLLVSSTIYAQQSEYEIAIKKQFQAADEQTEMNAENFDAEIIIKYTYPPLVELMGGEDQYIQLIQSSFNMADDMEEEEFYEEDEKEGQWTLKESKVELGDIGNVYQIGDELQSVIEIKEIDVYSDIDEISKRYMLTISRYGVISGIFLMLHREI